MRKINHKLKEIGYLGDKLQLPVYLVGGAVRDIISGRKSLDWDIVVEGDTAQLVKNLSKKWNAKIIFHKRFGTFILKINNTRHIDFVTARKETYPSPGALPVVELSNLYDDLFRRDFTINAIAIKLNKKSQGQVIDFFGGVKDLKKKELRVLHAKSFIDDPTRIMRLARFAGRGFKIAKNTENLINKSKKYLKNISDERLREEILAIIGEKGAVRSLCLLKKWGILKISLPYVKIKITDNKLVKLQSINDRLNYLLSNLSKKEFDILIKKLKLPKDLKKSLEKRREPLTNKPILTGKDLIKMGYKPGPMFKKMLNALLINNIKTRREASRFLFDIFPQKR